ncbi:MAG: hypothetical protein KJ576_20895 [Proteobacteria bacterium]|nr:hypothetical protein [Pseudomonadota bacterium]
MYEGLRKAAQALVRTHGQASGWTVYLAQPAAVAADDFGFPSAAQGAPTQTRIYPTVKKAGETDRAVTAGTLEPGDLYLTLPSGLTRDADTYVLADGVAYDIKSVTPDPINATEVWACKKRRKKQ